MRSWLGFRWLDRLFNSFRRLARLSGVELRTARIEQAKENHDVEAGAVGAPTHASPISCVR